MCFYCRCKTTRPSVTTHVVTFDDCIIIIKNVPCEECEECGEKYFSDEVMVRLEKIVEAARAIASEVFVTDYNNKSLRFMYAGYQSRGLLTPTSLYMT